MNMENLFSGPDDALSSVMKVIDRNGKGIAFIVDKEKHLKGVLTDGDIRKAVLANCPLDAPAQDLIDISSDINQHIIRLFDSGEHKAFKPPKPVSAKNGSSAQALVDLALETKARIIPLLDDDEKVVDYFEYAGAGHIPISSPSLCGNELNYVLQCIETNWISSQGRFVTEFGDKFAELCGQDYGIPTSSCTTALHACIAALGIGPGDEVICPTLTFIAPVNMIALAGAAPVLVDSEEDTWNCDPAEIERKITSKTKAIIVVHTFGHAARMDEIMTIADKKKIPVIEDVAEAPFARYKGRVLGSIGELSCFSFFGNKIITTGEGGMVVTNNEILKNRIEELRDHGMSKEQRYKHVELGYNYRMTNLQAAIGVAQLERFSDILAIRDKQEKAYEEFLTPAADLFSFRPKHDWCDTVHWMMTITLKKEGIRDRLIEYLKTKNVDSRQMVYPAHFADHFKSRYSSDMFPVSEKISLNSIHLPCSTDLTIDHVAYVSEIVVKWLKDNG